MAGKRGAAVMSLIQSARLNGHDPYAYLKDVLTRLPTQRNSQIGELLPHRWQAHSQFTCFPDTALCWGQDGVAACLRCTSFDFEPSRTVSFKHGGFDGACNHLVIVVASIALANNQPW